jgi:DNA-binding NtrC family response regulator
MSAQTKVLLIDDETEFVSALAERLRLRNYSARAVYPAEDALEIIRSDMPDVILLDFRMPGMDGVEVLKRIKAIDSTIEVIMITGHGDIQSIEEAVKGGAYEYIMKPINIKDLIVKIDSAKKKRSSSRLA